MSNSSILGGERAATQAAGRDAKALGPSDSSDSGSDIQGSLAAETPPMGEDQFSDTAGPANIDLAADSDATGTGERGAAVPGESAREGSDITPDQIESFGADPLDDPDTASLDDDADEIGALSVSEEEEEANERVP
jgi:hypothetical protein